MYEKLLYLNENENGLFTNKFVQFAGKNIGPNIEDICFSEHFALKLINVTTPYFDGTFKCVISQFVANHRKAQLLTINFIEGKTNFAAVYIIVPGKSMVLYKWIFNKVISLLPEPVRNTFKWKYFVADFEFCFASSFTSQFEDISCILLFQGYFFHYTQCIYRRI